MNRLLDNQIRAVLGDLNRKVQLETTNRDELQNEITTRQKALKISVDELTDLVRSRDELKFLLEHGRFPTLGDTFQKEATAAPDQQRRDVDFDLVSFPDGELPYPVGTPVEVWTQLPYLPDERVKPPKWKPAVVTALLEGNFAVEIEGVSAEVAPEEIRIGSPERLAAVGLALSSTGDVVRVQGTRSSVVDVEEMARSLADTPPRRPESPRELQLEELQQVINWLVGAGTPLPALTSIVRHCFHTAREAIHESSGPNPARLVRVIEGLTEMLTETGEVSRDSLLQRVGKAWDRADSAEF